MGMWNHKWVFGSGQKPICHRTNYSVIEMKLRVLKKIGLVELGGEV